MKKIVTILFILLSSFSFAQEFQPRKEKDKNKPSLFVKDSVISKLQPTFIEQLSKVERHDIVSLRVTTHTKIEGIVTRFIKMEKLISLTVNSLEIQNLILIYTDITTETGEHIYKAIIMSKEHKDVLILENNYWYKKEMSDLIPD
jgi:hypothetical protein